MDVTTIPPDEYEPDYAAAMERAMVDPVYAAHLKAQFDAEFQQTVTEPSTCGTCGTVLLQDETDDNYCPQCDD